MRKIYDFGPFFDPATFLAHPGLGREIVVLKPGEIFFTQGDRADSVFYLQSGRAELAVAPHKGKEATFRFLYPGDLVGEESLAAVPGLRQATATAIITCTALKFSREEMISVLHRERPFAEIFMKFLPAGINKLFRALRRTKISTRSSSDTAPEVDFRMLLEGSLDMIWRAKVKGSVHRYDYCSPSTSQILGWSVEEFVRLPLEAIFPPESVALIAEDVARISSGHKTSMVLIEAIRKDGTRVWLENNVRLLHSAPNGEMSIAIYLRDMTKRKLLEDQLEKLALIDGLTGIHNRRAFDQAIEREWKRALRAGSSLSLLLFDVDHFKLFNDTYGHQVGDDCLRAIAQCLRSRVNRSGDEVARYGGEEFTVLLPATESEGAEILANTLCQQVAGLLIPHSANDARGMVTVSCGVSTALARSGGTIKMPEGLLMAADAALYKAKREGRNRIATSFLLAKAEDDESAA